MRMHNVFWHVLTYTAQLREVFRVTQTKAMNLLLLENDSIVKEKRKKDHLFVGFCWHAGEKHHLYRCKNNSLDKHTL